MKSVKERLNVLESKRNEIEEKRSIKLTTAVISEFSRVVEVGGVEELPSKESGRGL